LYSFSQTDVGRNNSEATNVHSFIQPSSDCRSEHDKGKSQKFL